MIRLSTVFGCEPLFYFIDKVIKSIFKLIILSTKHRYANHEAYLPIKKFFP